MPTARLSHILRSAQRPASKLYCAKWLPSRFNPRKRCAVSHFARVRVRLAFYLAHCMCLSFRFLASLSPRDPSRFAALISAAPRLFFIPAGLWLWLGWLAACTLIIFFIACSGHGQRLPQAATNRVGRGLQPRCPSPS